MPLTKKQNLSGNFIIPTSPKNLPNFLGKKLIYMLVDFHVIELFFFFR